MLALMKNRRAKGRSMLFALAGSAIIAWLSLFNCPVSPLASESAGYAAFEIQHPLPRAVMPLNMPAPVVLWKTNVPGVGGWSASFKAGRRGWSFDGIQPMWRPPETEWRQIKQAAKGEPLELTVSGHEQGVRERIKAQSSVRFFLAAEAVNAPLFYRDVNLPFAEAVKDPSKIRWRFGSLETGQLPPVVLEKLPVCGNCHSFSRNGEYLAMDVDYSNNKGSYVITKTLPEMRLATSDIITWDDYRREDGEPTLGLLSQISPDGRYALSTVKDMSVFMAKPDLAFSQLFFPFKGIVGVYDRETKRFFSLPGAEDPDLVQSNPTWSPDGRWIVFARNRAIQGRKTRNPGRILLTGEAGEEFMREMRQYRYDLYRVPFNGGKGGKAEPLRGASANGRSNYFPKYSPDSRWIIFCQASNYMLLQPDSELFIIPAEGGEARRLGCNLGRMNSWHSWSPDGRWLVFASKAHSDYTQLYLTRISEQGEASPPVWLAHMVEAGRAANIPEFVPLPAGGIVRIHEQFLDDYSYVRAGDEFYQAGELDNAIEKYRLALSLNPDNATAHRLLGSLLYRTNHRDEGLDHMQAAVRLEPRNVVARFNLGLACSERGDQAGAIAHLEEAVSRLAIQDDRQYGTEDAKPAFPESLHFNLGSVYEKAGNLTKAEYHYREALRLAPDYPRSHYSLGLLLLRSGKTSEAEEYFVKVIQLVPGSADAHNWLGVVRQRQNRGIEALACFQKAVQCDTNNWRARLNLAFAYLSEGSRDQAIAELQEVLRIEPDCELARQALDKAQIPSR
jgi:tetratricopeptide (TPR) repeat protein